VSYAADRITAPGITAASFTRPAGFSLAKTWHQITTEFEQGLPLVPVRVRVRPDAVGRLRRVADTRCLADTDWAGVAESDGWLVLDIAFERLEYARQGLLGLGGAVEVLEPEQLRQEMISEVGLLAARYALAAPGPAMQPCGCK